MNIEQIRNKYRSILQEDIKGKVNRNIDVQIDENEQQKSQRQWINIVRKQKQKRVLTQVQHKDKQNNRSYIQRQKQQKKINITQKKNTKLSTEQIIIDLKQKLAQSILNCTRKDSQLNEFQLLILRKNQEIKLQSKNIHQLKNIIDIKDNVILQAKIKQDNYQKQIQNKSNHIEQLIIENQLLKKHIQNYAQQIQNINQRWKQEQKHYQKVQKQKQKTQSFKSKIQKLKDDIKRLQFLLSDNQVYAPLLVSLQGKHFLGKPNKQSKQLEYWYPQALISGVQMFLKKQQIAYGNKAFSQSLTKFIYGLLERSQKTGQRKGKNKYTLRIKQMQRKKNHILNVFENGIQNDSKKRSSRNSRLNASSLRKTTPLNGNSQLKSRDFSICLQKSLCFERQTLGSAKYSTNHDSGVTAKKPFIIQSLQKSVRMNQNHKNHVIMEFIQSFCKGIQKLFKLDNKTLVQQKVKELCSWLKQSVEEIYHTNNHIVHGDYIKQTGKWKTVAD